MTLEEYLAICPPTEPYRVIEARAYPTQQNFPSYLVKSVCGCEAFQIVQLCNGAAVPGQVQLDRNAVEPLQRAIAEIEAEVTAAAKDSNRFMRMFGDID